MRPAILALVLAATLAVIVSPNAAEAWYRGSHGYGCCWADPWWRGPAPVIRWVVPPVYVAPAPVYVPPPPVYLVPPQAYVVPPPVYRPSPPAYGAPSAALDADPVSPVYTDRLGRTCRDFQAYAPGGATSGTACLEADGIWRVAR